MRNLDRTRRHRNDARIRTFLWLGLGVVLAFGVVLQSTSFAQDTHGGGRPNARQGGRAFVPPLQGMTATGTPTPFDAVPTFTPTPTGTAPTATPGDPGPTFTPTPFGQEPTLTPTTDGTVDPTLPDLIVVGMVVSTENGESCWPLARDGLRVFIRNDGGGAAGTFSVTANGTMTEIVPGLDANSSTSVWFPSYIAFDDNTATIDSANQVLESNETNNTLTRRVASPTPPPPCTATPTETPTPDGTVDPLLPDLVIAGMQIALESGNACATSTQLGLRVFIHNDGAAAGAFDVTANGTTTARVAGIAEGETLTVWLPGYTYAAENSATVDSANEVVESDETNNTRTEMLPIPTLPIPCTATPTTDPNVTPTTTPTVGPEPTGRRMYLPQVSNARERSPTPER